MQNPILTNPKLKDWLATLVALSIFTIFLVLNLPHITKFGPPIRALNDRMWVTIYQTLIGIRTLSLQILGKRSGSSDALAGNNDMGERQAIELGERQGAELEEPRMTGAGEEV
jgi:hypothetical protein